MNLFARWTFPLGNCVSKYGNISFDVPQRFILGSLLFLIYLLIFYLFTFITYLFPLNQVYIYMQMLVRPFTIFGSNITQMNE